MTITPFGIFVCVYLLCMLLELINNLSLAITEIELAPASLKAEAQDELLSPVALIKLIFLTILWPAGIIVKVYMAADFLSARYGTNELEDKLEDKRI